MPEALDSLARVVTRTGKRVEIVHRMGSHKGTPIVYELSSTAMAKVFEEDAKKKTKGYPSTISMRWNGYLVREPYSKGKEKADDPDDKSSPTER